MPAGRNVYEPSTFINRLKQVSTSDTIGYWLGVFALGLCLVVASVYFTQASQDLEYMKWQVHQLKQRQKGAPLKPKAGKPMERQAQVPALGELN